MFKSIKFLEVYYRSIKVGRLAESPDGLSAFEYDTEWLQKGFSISPIHLPLQSGLMIAKKNPFDGLFGIFEDSLPDGWGKLLIDRWLISKGFLPAEVGMITRLSLVGESGLGALTYKPANNTELENTQYRSIEYYAAEVHKILNNQPTSSLDEMVNKAGSSGGARPKVLLKLNGEDWLIKFPSSMDPINVGEIEYEYSLKAKKCGIIMPETKLFEDRYFGVKRFDIQNNKRMHLHSAAGLLYASHRLPSLDYKELLKATLYLCRNMREVEKMFRLMVFNVLIGNKDDHAKNFSFIYQEDHWEVSPAYDLLPSDGFNGNHSTTVMGKGLPDLNDCLEAAKIVRLDKRKAKMIIEEVKEGLNS